MLIACNDPSVSFDDAALSPAWQPVRAPTSTPSSTHAGIAHFRNVPSDPRYQFLLETPADTTQSGEAYNPVLLAKSVQFDPIIEKAGAAAEVEPDLLRAVIPVQSGFNARRCPRPVPRA